MTNPLTSAANFKPQPATANVTAKSLAEKLKKEGEAEQARGEQLQQDGVELQKRGTSEQKIGEIAKQFGQLAKEKGQADIASGQAQRAQGDQQISGGIEGETTARAAQDGHTQAFAEGLGNAIDAQTSAGANIGAVEAGLSAEAEALAAQTEQLGQFAGELGKAAGNLAGSRATQAQVGEDLKAEQTAFTSAQAGTESMKQGLDQQAAGRSLAGEGRDALRTADGLRVEAEQFKSQSKDLQDKSAADARQSGALFGESILHRDSATVFAGEAAIAGATGVVVGAQSEEQKALADLLAAKAAIDQAAAKGLSALPNFATEAEHTEASGNLASLQAHQYSERGAFYSELSGALAEESTQLSNQAGTEKAESGRKAEQSTTRMKQAFGKLRAASEALDTAFDLKFKGEDLKKEGDAKIVEGTTQQTAGAEVLAGALNQIGEATTAQEAAHASQSAGQANLEALNTSTGETVTARQSALDGLKGSGDAQEEALVDQLVGLVGLAVDQAAGAESQAARSEAAEGLKQTGADISGAVAGQQTGFDNRTAGTETEKSGAKSVRYGERVTEKGQAYVDKGAEDLKSGAQTEQAGKVVAEKGRQYQDLANKTLTPAEAKAKKEEEAAKQSAEIPYHLA